MGRFGGVNRLFSRRRRRVWPTVSVFGSTPIFLDDSIVTGLVGGSAPRFCAPVLGRGRTGPDGGRGTETLILEKFILTGAPDDRRRGHALQVRGTGPPYFRWREKSRSRPPFRRPPFRPPFQPPFRPPFRRPPFRRGGCVPCPGRRGPGSRRRVEFTRAPVGCVSVLPAILLVCSIGPRFCARFEQNVLK